MRDSTRYTNERGATGSSPRVRRLSFSYVNKIDVNLGSHDKQSANLAAATASRLFEGSHPVNLWDHNKSAAHLGESMKESNQFGEFAICVPPIQGSTICMTPTRRAYRLPGVHNQRAASSRGPQHACFLPDGRATSVPSTWSPQSSCRLFKRPATCLPPT
ncbi:uncharacterized protein LOC143197785 [Rhynchophorus ferrugineus]|uniref:uncharacterized protein LOC143197785 n=1 Tax=Rhynchophorus ferrugineus TaxID=354439 RepID=UPI003FCD499A